MVKQGRPLGAKNKNGYDMTAAAYHQRVMANISRHGTESSLIYNAVMKEQGLSESQIELLNKEKIAIWKKFDTPSIMLMDEYAMFKTMVNMKMLKGVDPTDKEMRECLRLLLDIAKEINRLRTVSADKKFEAFTKSFSESDEIEIDITPEQDVIIGEEEDEIKRKDKVSSEEVQEDSDTSTDIQNNTN